MIEAVKSETPTVGLATKDWALRELMDTERRIEKAFHEQTQFLSQKMDNNVRWMIGLIVTMTIAIILAVLFKA